jgi:hypothetical protein
MVIYSALIKYWIKNMNAMKQCVSFKNSYDSDGGGVLYNVLTEFGIPMKLVRLIKMCPN